MSLKIKALLHTIAIISVAVLTASGVSFILNHVSTETVLNALGFAVVGMFVYLLYSITLSRLEYNEKLKELKETIKG